MTCWKSEYDWDVSRRSDTQSKETVLTVLFDNGAQRQFSRVRIMVLVSDSVATEQHTAWQISSHSSPLVVVRHVSEDKPTDPSLPVCRVAFVADQHSARSQTIAEVAKLCGELVLTEFTCASTKLFEFDYPMAKNIQSISVSFTSSCLLSTKIPRGHFLDPWVDQPATIGRVVRVIHTDERRTISLPKDVLFLIFEILCSSYRSWRQDLLSAALVCREWSCALDVLLIDFRSQDSQDSHPPEIVRFANGLVVCPSLALDIKYLSAGYLEKHPSWDPCPVLPPGNPSPMFLAKLQLQQNPLRRARFANAFLSILHVAKNVQTLSLDTANPLVVLPDGITDALSGLNRLDTFDGKCPLSMAQLLSCIATWPALKRLALFSILSPSTPTAPSPAVSCRLTELALVGVPIQDNELACLVSASGATLQRLTLDRISHLTNVGLGAALIAVSASLTYLCIVTGALTRALGEEHALDTTITRMTRLTELEITPEVASERMVERRAEAFTQRTALLSKIHLYLVIGDSEEQDGLVSALDRGWAGWTSQVVRR